MSSCIFALTSKAAMQTKPHSGCRETERQRRRDARVKRERWDEVSSGNRWGERWKQVTLPERLKNCEGCHFFHRRKVKLGWGNWSNWSDKLRILGSQILPITTAKKWTTKASQTRLKNALNVTCLHCEADYINISFLWPLSAHTSLLSVLVRGQASANWEAHSDNVFLPSESLSVCSWKKTKRTDERGRVKAWGRKSLASHSAAFKASWHIPADQRRVRLSHSPNRADSWHCFVAGGVYYICGCLSYDSPCWSLLNHNTNGLLSFVRMTVFH